MKALAYSRFLSILILVALWNPQKSHADVVSDALDDGQAGRFDAACQKFKQQSMELEAQTTSADIMLVGRNCAAIGFNTMMATIASDCTSGTLSTLHGKELFDAAREARNGNLSRAEISVRSIVDAVPEYAPGHWLLGRILMGKCLQEGGGSEQAVLEYQKAIALDKTMVSSYLDLGLLHEHVGDSDEAIKAYETALAVVKDATGRKFTQLMLAILYCKSEQWSLAKEHAQKAKELGFSGIAADLLNDIEQHIPSESQGKVEDLHALASSLSTKEIYEKGVDAGIEGEYGNAVGWLQEAKQREPDRMPIVIASILAEEAKNGRIGKDAAKAAFTSIKCGNTNKWDEALALAKEACEKSSNSAPLFSHLGTVYAYFVAMGKGDQYAQDAISAYQRALKIDPESGVTWFNLGLAQGATQNWVSAKESLLKAKALGVNVPQDILSQIESRM
jgi:tetratricopeptide (TPR) repeat protein